MLNISSLNWIGPLPISLYCDPYIGPVSCADTMGLPLGVNDAASTTTGVSATSTMGTSGMSTPSTTGKDTINSAGQRAPSLVLFGLLFQLFPFRSSWALGNCDCYCMMILYIVWWLIILAHFAKDGTASQKHCSVEGEKFGIWFCSFAASCDFRFPPSKNNKIRSNLENKNNDWNIMSFPFADCQSCCFSCFFNICIAKIILYKCFCSGWPP